MVNFSDGTNQTFTSLAISDWYYGSNFAIQGIGRINITNNNLESGNGTDPRLYQIPLSIDVANQSKNIVSVTFTKTGTGGIPNIFALSADAYNPCPTPANVTATTTVDTATLSWSAPTSVPSSGYQYYYSTSSTAPTATTQPTGNVTSGTSVTLNNLTTGQTYYFWVRSNCGGSSQSFWKMKEFTPGQISASYTLGDINTEYDDIGVDTSSTTNCPGSLSVTIPAGYKISSTSVSYAMSTVSNGWMSEQESFLVCTTNGTAEATVSEGSGNNSGTYSYNRTGLTIANNLTGTVNFDLRAWRTYGDSGCGATHNKVDNNTWKVTVTLEPIALSTNETEPKTKERLAYPNPFQDVLNIEKSENIKRLTVTDLSGVTVKTVENPSATLRLEGVKSGVYILSYVMKDGSLKSTKIIKK